MRPDSAYRIPEPDFLPCAFLRVLWPALLLFFACSRFLPLEWRIASEIRQKIPKTRAPAVIIMGNEPVRSAEEVSFFYRQRNYRPVWMRKGNVSHQADSLVSALQESGHEGLDPEEYHLKAIRRRIIDARRLSEEEKRSSQASFAELDILLSDAFFRYSSHLARGKTGGKGSPDGRIPHSVGKTSARTLENAVAGGRIRESFKSHIPQHSFYTHLKKALARYERLSQQGGWELLPAGLGMNAETGGMAFGEYGSHSGKDASPADKAVWINRLKERLEASGDLFLEEVPVVTGADSTIARSVAAFQKRHGLAATGAVDSATLRALNVPVEERILQIRLAMDRWRSLPHEPGSRFLQVNIPDFTLDVFEDGKTVLHMKVVLGSPEWPTPVFNAVMTHVIFNPSWSAPSEILLKELRYYIQSDSNYLKNNKMKLVRYNGDEQIEVNPESVDWDSLDRKSLDFRLRQEPGALNIMGRYKFLCPNEYDVYMHDTPYREDFARLVRMQSHGCIRVEKPLELASYLLARDHGWTREKILDAVESVEESSLELRRPLPARVVYFTAWVDEDGILQFRDDVYGLDRRIASAFF